MRHGLINVKYNETSSLKIIVAYKAYIYDQDTNGRRSVVKLILISNVFQRT